MPGLPEDCVIPLGARVMKSEQKHCSEVQKEAEARDTGDEEAAAFVPDDFSASSGALGKPR